MNKNAPKLRVKLLFKTSRNYDQYFPRATTILVRVSLHHGLAPLQGITHYTASGYLGQRYSYQDWLLGQSLLAQV